MEFRILGPLEVIDDALPIDLGGSRQRALLAILLTQANHVVSRDRLIDDLFGEEPRETAVNLVQVYVSRLRKALEPGRARRESKGIVTTRSPGYVVRVEPDQLDLHRFERLTEEGRSLLAAGDAPTAQERLASALGLWRGGALADFAFEPFAQREIRRLEELRLAALEDRIDADLALGRHGQLAGELETLSEQYPLRERLRGQLMLALYRSSRQAEALDVYQATRRALVDQLGIEPGESLQRLERAVLQHDPELDWEPGAAPGPVMAHEGAAGRSILLLPSDEVSLDALVTLAEPLARFEPRRELVLARLVGDGAELESVAADLNHRRDLLRSDGLIARAAAFTSHEPGADAVRLAQEQDVELALVAGFAVWDGELTGGTVGPLLAQAPCDIGVLCRTEEGDRAGAPVVVPFGGFEHDWAALELAAWIATARAVVLRLLGPVGDPVAGRRDASRLLARASLLVQRFVGVAAEPVLTAPGPEAVIEASRDASLIVVGMSSRWRDEGLGPTRAEIVAEAGPATVLAARGARPGGLAPAESLTRFTWSLREAVDA